MSGRCRLVNGRIRRSILQVIDGLQGIHRTTLYVTGTPCSSGLARPHVHSARSSARPLEPRHGGGSRVGQLAVFRRVPLGDQVAAACPFRSRYGGSNLTRWRRSLDLDLLVDCRARRLVPLDPRWPVYVRTNPPQFGERSRSDLNLIGKPDNLARNKPVQESLSVVRGRNVRRAHRLWQDPRQYFLRSCLALGS
jgi:hypothetical protein